MLKSQHSKFILLLLLLFTYLNSHADRDDDLSFIMTAAFTVHIDQDIIDATGLQTQELHNTQYSPEFETFATRIDLTPLINTRQKFFTALAKQTNAQINYKQSLYTVQRLESLQREKAISTRKLLAQKSQLEIDKAKLKAADQQVANIRLHTQAKWGKVLSLWFLDEPAPYTNMLKTLNRPVYLIYLPASYTPPITSVFVHPFSLREKAQAAQLISAAATYSTHQQATGSAFFYLSDQAEEAYHPRVTTWLPLNEGTQSGVIIPASAIVWHLGQAYVYLQIDDELFARVKITQKTGLGTDSYFIQQTLQEGVILVISGAQMLLSEEFRGQIPAEDDDDDD